MAYIIKFNEGTRLKTIESTLCNDYIITNYNFQSWDLCLCAACHKPVRTFVLCTEKQHRNEEKHERIKNSNFRIFVKKTFSR